MAKRKLKSSYPGVCSHWLQRTIDISWCKLRHEFLCLLPFPHVTVYECFVNCLNFFFFCMYRRRKGRRAATSLAAPPFITLCSHLAANARKIPKLSWTSTYPVSWRHLAASHQGWFGTHHAQAPQIGQMQRCPLAMGPSLVLILGPPRFWWQEDSPQSTSTTTTSTITMLGPRPRSRSRPRRLSACSASALQGAPIIPTSPLRKCNFWAVVKPVVSQLCILALSTQFLKFSL